ncbi:MAG: beta-galactosidase family protein [Planctomycetota bacterium]
MTPQGTRLPVSPYETRRQRAPARSPRVLEVRDGCFVRNGEPHQIISGSMCYFRIVPEAWRDRLHKLKAMGCNAVEIYVPWNAHEPRPGVYTFDGRLNIERFLDLCVDLELDVIFRPGPYICGEWEFGGLPWWLLRERGLTLRSSNPRFLELVDRWWDVLLPRVRSYCGSEGGPIVAVQIENEYGYYGRDPAYLRHLLTSLQEGGIDALPFTSDGVDAPHNQAHGGLPGVLRTANFGSRPEERLAKLDEHQDDAPRMCMEFWVGWFDAWGNARKAARDHESVASDLRWMLQQGDSVNLFVVCGGTNFGFMSGANHSTSYAPHVTSYDYDGLLTECGDATDKYYACRRVIAECTGRKDLNEVFPPSPKLPFKRSTLTEMCPLADGLSAMPAPIAAERPWTLEETGEGYGYVMYAARVPASLRGSRLRLRGMHDFAHVLLDGQSKGTWYRNDPEPEWSMDFVGEEGRLTILVDCMARATFGHRTQEQKGICEGVFFGKDRHYECAISGWDTYPLPMRDLSKIPWRSGVRSVCEPCFYRATFYVKDPADTFLHLAGAGKGFASVNGENLGRYWSIGPQHSLYVPRSFLREGANELVVFDVIGLESTAYEFREEPVWTR